MTPADDTMDGRTGDASGTHLSTTDGSEAFLPGPEAPAASKSAASWLLDYSAHAAMIVGLVGFAWTVSNHVVNRPAAPAGQAANHAAATPKVDELAELRRANQQMAEDLGHVRAKLDALTSAVHDDKTAAKVRVLQTGLESVQSGLTAVRGDATSAVAQINGKIEKIEHEPAARLQQLSERLGRLEKGMVDPAPTGSLASPRTASAAPATPAAVPVPPAKPAKVASLEEPHHAPDAHRADEARAQNAKPSDTKAPEARAADAKPQDAKAADAKPVLPGYVVRDVYDGVALIEGRRGPMEVVPGVSIPGAGVVRSIERHGNGWTVTTSKGLLAYAAPPKDYRRAGRGYYPAYREEY